MPELRSADWGQQVRGRALERARRVIAAAARYGLPEPTVESLAEILRERERVGAVTAATAAETALTESRVASENKST